MKYLLATAAILATIGTASADPPGGTNDNGYIHPNSACRNRCLRCQVIDRNPPLNARSVPGGRILDELPQGLSVTIRDHQGSWVYVDPEVDANGWQRQSGWVPTTLLGNCRTWDDKGTTISRWY
jgi:hypothetical protein